MFHINIKSVSSKRQLNWHDHLQHHHLTASIYLKMVSTFQAYPHLRVKEIE